ncbi:MAG TPA: ATP-binding cassette domain-containing protein, partial [Gammaproteobacteria bacterium]|nr:ATP-binding cassette domain-containing protein [Gammaproteobacteria bacterium]
GQLQGGRGVSGRLMLNISRLNHYYGASHTLWDLDLEVLRGSCTCLIGRNGVGKTTLLKCIMGLLSIHTGTIQLEGQDLVSLPAHRGGPQSFTCSPGGGSGPES